MRFLVINPNTSAGMTAAIAEECRKVAAPGTIIDAISPEYGPRSIETHTEDAIAAAATIDAVLKHREDGYDAIIVACFIDPALMAIREIVDVPVIGIAEAAAHLAALVAPRFSVVTVMRRLEHQIAATIDRSGLADRCASVRSIDLSVLGLEEDIDATLAAMEQESRRAIEEDGAEAILLGCAGLGPLDKELQARLGVPVLDGCGCAVKLAEACIGYGVSTSKVLSYSSPPAKEYVGMPDFSRAFGA
ncbi:aspartate/glutamate racemase family protein [Leucobacter sp. gxy201]|uniref:aspartate/glutamate racemase family protein n=1 Tax=Leucobacter sp. gxy201 TaxID=2957200 RepID=UPI003DA0A12E